MKPERTLKVFLASGQELRKDCTDIQTYLYDDLKEQLASRNVEIKVERWEKLDLSLSKEPKQPEFTERMLQCDILVVLVRARIGPNTLEEFERACEKALKQQQGPKILVFFRNDKISLTEASASLEQLSQLAAFRKRVQEAGQIHVEYETIETLTLILARHIYALLREEDGKVSALLDPALGISGLPAYPEVFVNREKESDAIMRDLKAGCVVHLRGFGGVGKTDLATVAAYRLTSFFEGRILFFLRFDKFSLDDALNSVLNYGRAWRAVQGQRREKLLLVKQVLAAPSRKFLIVLDNVEEFQKQEIEELLSVRGQASVLLTSRVEESLSFSQEKVHYLTDLSVGDSIALLRAKAADRLSDGEFRALWTIVSGNPFVLTCAASLLNAPGADAMKLMRLLARRPALLEEHNQHIKDIFHYTYEHLTDEQRQVLAALVTFGSDSFSAEAVAAVSHQEDVEVDLLRFELRNIVKCLPQSNRYYMHPMTRYCAEKCLPAKLVTRTSRSMVRYFLELVQPGIDIKRMEALKLEKANLLAAIDRAQSLKDFTAVIQFITRLNGSDAYYGFFGRNGFWREGIDKTRLGVAAAQNLDEKRLEACFRRDIAQFHYWLGANQAARKYCEESLAILSEKCQPEEMVRIQHVLGYITDDEGQYREARSYYEGALRLAQKERLLELEAMSYHLVGVIDYHQQRYLQARRQFQKSLESIAALNHSVKTEHEQQRYVADEARCKRRFAALARVQAHYATGPERQRFLAEAMELIAFALSQERSERSRARGWRQKGMIHEEQGLLKEAEECYHTSLELFEAIGNLKGKGTTKFNLGCLAERRDETEKASTLFTESAEVAKTVNCPFGIAMVQWHLGRLAAKEKRVGEAWGYLQEAHAALKENQPLYAAEVAELMRRLHCKSSHGRKPA